MNEDYPKLARPPIVEAIVDFDCDVPPNVDLKSLEQSARETFHEHYPDAQPRYLQEVRVATGQDGAFNSSLQRSLQAWMFRASDGTQLVQVRQSGFSFNRLAPYAGFDMCLPLIEEAWRRYCDLVKPIVVREIRLRYINRISLPMDRVENEGLESFLAVDATPPTETKLVRSGFLTQYQASDPETCFRAAVVLASQPASREWAIACRIRQRGVGQWTVGADWLGENSRRVRVFTRDEEPYLLSDCQTIMLGAIPMTSACVATYGSFKDWGQSSAVSGVAASLHELVCNLSRSADDAQTLSGRDTSFENGLMAALDELVVDEDQYAVSTAAVQRALRLIQSLPNGVPIPDVAVDPDGEIALDWMPSRTRMFSISVGDSDRLAYAWIDGSDRARGVFRFTSAIPQPLLLQLAELTTGGRASIRAA